MLAFASNLLLAILTGRVILLDKVKMDMFSTFPDEFYVDQSKPKVWNINQILYNDFTNQTDRPVLLQVNSNRPASDRMFFVGGQKFQSLQRVKYLVTTSEQYFIPGFYFHPEFRYLMKKWFPDNIVYKRIFELIYTPSDKVQEKVKSIFEKFDRETEFVVGIQYRRTEGYNQEVQPFLQKCLQNKDMIEVSKGKKLAFLMVSLYPQATADLRKAIEPMQAKIVQPTQYNKQQDSVEEVEDAFAEILALASCDRLIVSTKSTLGYQAQVLSKAPQFYLALNNKGVSEACWPSNIKDPCYHQAAAQSFVNVGFDLDRLGLQHCVDRPDFDASVQLQP